MLSNHQFERARRLALSLAGIQLVERHRELLERRSRRLGIPTSTAFESMLADAEAGEVVATQTFLGLLTTKFTDFFRHPRHFEIAAQHAVQAARIRGRADLWSAGTATGEEAWSMAMALIEAFGSDDPPASVLATDVDVEALGIAERAVYSELALKTLSEERRGRFLCSESLECCGSTQRSVSNTPEAFESPAALRTQSGPAHAGPHSRTLARHTSRRSNAALFRVSPVVRRLVEFRPLNLAHTEWPVEGPFDVILCRNVLMYLDACHRYAVLERMASLLAPGALLLLDPTEHPAGAGHWFAPTAEGVYSRRFVAVPTSRRYSELARHR